MNETDLSLIDAHINIEIHRLQKLLLARNWVYQLLPAGQKPAGELQQHQEHLRALMPLLDGTRTSITLPSS